MLFQSQLLMGWLEVGVFFSSPMCETRELVLLHLENVICCDWFRNSVRTFWISVWSIHLPSWCRFFFFLCNGVIIVTLLRGNSERWPGQTHAKCCVGSVCELIPARWRREPLFCPLISGARQSSSSARCRYLRRRRWCSSGLRFRCAAATGTPSLPPKSTGWRDDAQIWQVLISSMSLLFFPCVCVCVWLSVMGFLEGATCRL